MNIKKPNIITMIEIIREYDPQFSISSHAGGYQFHITINGLDVDWYSSTFDGAVKRAYKMLYTHVHGQCSVR